MTSWFLANRQCCDSMRLEGGKSAGEDVVDDRILSQNKKNIRERGATAKKKTSWQHAEKQPAQLTMMSLEDILWGNPCEINSTIVMMRANRDECLAALIIIICVKQN